MWLLQKLPLSLKRFVRKSARHALTGARERIPEQVPPRLMEKRIRCGVVGMGEMGKRHAATLREHDKLVLAAVASRQSDKRKVAAQLGCAWFETPDHMIQSGDVDVVVVATPHPNHPDIVVAAMKAGLHVICEKPLAVTAAQADIILAASKNSTGVLTVVFQNRFAPAYLFVKSLLDEGGLGRILRCEITETFWRPDAYFRSAPWRGTWRGEGGGVLVNQAPHLIDRYLWFCGMPQDVAGFCDTILHPIKVEDSACAIFRHSSGMHGYLRASTSEAPWMSRTLLVCDRGVVSIENDLVRVCRFNESIKTFSANASVGVEDIAGETAEYEPMVGSLRPDLLSRFYDNFACAVAGLGPLMVTPQDAAHAVELANAVQLSSAGRRTISLPLNRDEYEQFLAAKITEERNGSALP